MLTIDGAHGEGGGQILRTSVALSILLQQPVEIVNIRAKRPKPGLQPQHWTAVRAAAAICDAELAGVEIGSVYLQFSPRRPARPGEYTFNISEMIGRGSAGAVNLIFQTLLVPLLLADQPSRLALEGGTHVPHSPSSDFLRLAYLPAMRWAGADFDYELETAGYYPQGGGRITAEIRPSTLRGLNWETRGALKTSRAMVSASSLPDHVAERGAAVVEEWWKGRGLKQKAETERPPSPSIGASVTIAAECENGCAAFLSLGERGKPMERVANDACQDYERWWRTGAAVDEHLADQLVLPMLMAEGPSAWSVEPVSLHLATVIWLAKQFADFPIELEGELGGPGVVRVRR